MLNKLLAILVRGTTYMSVNNVVSSAQRLEIEGTASKASSKHTVIELIR